MKRGGILNSALSALIASLGHGDSLVIGDAGLPVPKGVDVIDLAIGKNIPTFLDVIQTVLSELSVEEAIVAEEMERVSPGMYEEFTKTIGDVGIKKVSHSTLKEMIASTKAVVRTGEFTPYSNVILVSSRFR